MLRNTLNGLSKEELIELAIDYDSYITNTLDEEQGVPVRLDEFYMTEFQELKDENNSYPKYFIKFVELNIGNGDIVCKSCNDKDDLLETANFTISQYTNLTNDENLKIINEKVSKSQLEEMIDANDAITIIAKYNNFDIDFNKRLYITVHSLYNLLKIAEYKINKEIREKGFIEDSQGQHEFINNLIDKDLIGCSIDDNVFSELDNIIHEEILNKHYKNIIGLKDERMLIYYYDKDLNFKSVQELEKYFKNK